MSDLSSRGHTPKFHMFLHSSPNVQCFVLLYVIFTFHASYIRMSRTLYSRYSLVLHNICLPPIFQRSVPHTLLTLIFAFQIFTSQIWYMHSTRCPNIVIMLEEAWSCIQVLSSEQSGLTALLYFLWSELTTQHYSRNLTDYITSFQRFVLNPQCHLDDVNWLSNVFQRCELTEQRCLVW